MSWSIPTSLITCHHTLTAGQALLRPFTTGDAYEDFLEGGAEPDLTRTSSKDAPDCAGRVHGELYHRGNTRWTITVRRWVGFFHNVYPIYVNPEADPLVVKYADPIEHAQKFLTEHDNALPDAATTLSWNGASWQVAIVESRGRTVGPFCQFEYTITAAKD